MRKIIQNIVIIFLLLSSSINAQQKINVSGFVKSRNNGERLIGAHITEAETPNGTASDYNGYFNLVVQKNPSLKVSFIGYKDLFLNLHIDNDTILDIALSEDIEQLAEVTINAQRKLNSNISTLNYVQMTQTPSLGGKPDVIKTPATFTRNKFTKGRIQPHDCQVVIRGRTCTFSIMSQSYMSITLVDSCLFSILR